MRGLLAAWQKAARTPGVVRFLLGRFLYTDAINTLIGGFLALFVLTELNLSTRDVNNLLGVAITAAIGGGLGGGRLTRLLGAQEGPAMRCFSLWVAALGLGAFTAAIGVTWLIWVVGVLGGLALGATWTADRVLMLELSPPENIGEFYGLYATVGRFATILGPLVWATRRRRARVGTDRRPADSGWVHPGGLVGGEKGRRVGGSKSPNVSRRPRSRP